MYRLGILANLIFIILPDVLGSTETETFYSRLGEPTTLSFYHAVTQPYAIACHKDSVLVFSWNPSKGDSGTFSQTLAAGRASFSNSQRRLNITISRADEADDGLYHCRVNDTQLKDFSMVVKLQFITFTPASYVVTSSPKVTNTSNIIKHFLVEPVIINFQSQCSKPPVKYTIESRLLGIYESTSETCQGKSSYGKSTLNYRFFIKKALRLTATVDHPSLKEKNQTYEIQLRPQCEMLPCQNHGTCVGQLEWYRCECPDEFDGVHCQLKKGLGADPHPLPVATIIGICVGIVVAVILVVVIVLLVLHYKKDYERYKSRRKHATFARYMRRKLPRSPSMGPDDKKPIASKYKKVGDGDKDKKKKPSSDSKKPKEKKDGAGKADGDPLLDKNENTPGSDGESKEKPRQRVEKSHSTRSQDRPERPRRSGEGKDSSHRREGRESSKGEGKDPSRRKEGRDSSKGEDGRESSRRKEGRDPSRRVEGKESFRRDEKDPSRQGVRREPSGGRSDRQRPSGERRDKDRGKRAPSDAKDRRPRERRERPPPPGKEKEKTDKERTEKEKTGSDTKDKPDEAVGDTSNAPLNVSEGGTKHDVSGLKVL